MHKVLFLIPSLDNNGAAQQFTQLAAGLPRERFQPRVCVLGRGTGMECEALRWRGPLDLRSLHRLWSLVRSFRPDVIHAWQLPALRAVLPAAWRGPGRLVVSSPLSPDARTPRLNPLDRWLLRRAHRTAVTGPAEAEHCRHLGLPADKLVYVPPGVVLSEDRGSRIEDRSSPTRSSILDPQSSVRLLAAIGPLEPREGFLDAIWALDILRFVYDDLHLLLVGQGPDQLRLEAFARAIGVEHCVHFVADPPDVPALLARAELVWVPSQTESGVQTALLAMAAGRPVVAANLPSLAEIVRDGETGVLFPPGDKAALARQTRLLLNDPDRRRRLGEAGRQRAVDHFSVKAMVERYAQLYETLLAEC